MDKQAIRYHTALSGEFFVAAQLQRFCVAASVTYGNAKRADVIAFSKTSTKATVIEVKASSKGRWPVGSRVPPPSDKPWVFVHLPPKINEPPEFFVMTQNDVHALLSSVEKEYFERYRKKHGVEYGGKPGVAAMTKKLALNFKDNWDAILDLIKT